MKLSTLTTFVEALLSLYQIVRLPYPVGILFFIALGVLAYIGHVRKLKLAGYFSFFGFLILSAILGGYYADVKGVEGSLLPELVVGGVGTLLILSEVLKTPVSS